MGWVLGGPCHVACADEIWKALVELDSPPTVLSWCVSCSFGLPSTPPVMIRDGSRLRVALFEMPCAATAPSAMPLSFTCTCMLCVALRLACKCHVCQG